MTAKRPARRMTLSELNTEFVTVARPRKAAPEQPPESQPTKTEFDPALLLDIDPVVALGMLALLSPLIALLVIKIWAWAGGVTF